MIKHSYKDGLELMVAAKNEAVDVKSRHLRFKKKYYEAINEQNYQIRLEKMKSLRDELNGYYIRIHSIVTKGITYYKNQSKKKRWLQRISRRGKDTIYEIDKVMKEMSVTRNESAHDVVYQINLKALDDTKEIQKILFKIADKIRSVTTYTKIDEKREAKSQDGWLVNRFKEYEGFDSDDMFYEGYEDDVLLPIDYKPSFMYK